MTKEQLEINRYSPYFDLCVIPKLHALALSSLSRIPTTFPLQVNYLYCKKIQGTFISNFIAQNVLLFDSSITAYSDIVKTLFVHNNCVTNCVYCDTLPNFPNLQCLELRGDYILNMDRILEKYPQLTFLEIRCKDINFIDALKSFKHKLVITCLELVDITCFSILQCLELDLSGCPKIQDFSFVAHIPIVTCKNKIPVFSSVSHIPMQK
jgi:hypothetical protein